MPMELATAKWLPSGEKTKSVTQPLPSRANTPSGSCHCVYASAKLLSANSRDTQIQIHRKKRRFFNRDAFLTLAHLASGAVEVWHLNVLEPDAVYISPAGREIPTRHSVLSSLKCRIFMYLFRRKVLLYAHILRLTFQGELNAEIFFGPTYFIQPKRKTE